ncbi:MAG: TetR family transcriptional regulator [Actinobacteria bacterium]|nr:TetR family transcriptional regulator [Actinomycetota bacterium]
MPSSEHSPSDGRTARRSENRDAALRCVVRLFSENKLVPTIEMVAEASGVSIRSLYRYFGDGQTMVLEAIEGLVAEAKTVGIIPNVGEGTFAERVEALVAARFRAYRLVRFVLRAALVNIANNPDLTASQHRTRGLLEFQFKAQFAPELSQLDEAEQTRVTQSGSAICNLEFIDMLSDRQGINEQDAQTIVRRLLTDILAP